VRTTLAVIFALGAALLYGLGNAVEHRVATDTESTSTFDVGLLGRLARRPLWVVGMVGDVGAYGLQAAALAFGALLVVQPLLACGLLVALPLSAHWTHRRVRGREWIAAAVLCVSLATFLVEADPGGGTSSAPVGSWLRIGGTVGIVIVLAVALAAGTRGHVRAALLGFAAGGLFGITAALTKTFVEQIPRGVPYTASHWEVYALALLSVIGILFTQNGFQSSSLSASLPALEATEPVVAAIMGVALLHEHLDGRTPFDNVLIGASILAALACVVFLAAMAGQDAVRAQTPTDTDVTVGPAPVRARRTEPRPHPRPVAVAIPGGAAADVDAHRRRRVPARPRRRRPRHLPAGPEPGTGESR
jgi:drug/metabolite transporter (DMT)-like permease